MSTDEKILKTLEDLQTGQKALQADISTVKDGQQKQGEQLETLKAGQENLQAQVMVLQAGQKTLESGQQALELKVEAVHSYQKQAHDEIMGHLIDTTEIAGRDQKILEKRIERIEKHLGLPPLK